ncbi:MAG: UbiA family prenyltransferase [Kiritimatiellia bacterium]
MAGDPPALWQQIVRESLWGTRGVAKAGGMGLPLAALLSRLDFIPTRAPADALLLFASAACFVLFGTLVNDLADKAPDCDAGKQRWIQSVPDPVAGLIVLSIIAIGTLLSSFSPVWWKTTGVYLCAVFLALAYSLPPLRMKERGIWGFLCFALCIIVCYVFFPWSWFGGTWIGPAVIAAALFLDRWVNLHFHQIVDHARDFAQGQRTYAVRVGLKRARATLRFAVWTATAMMLGVLLWIGFGLGAKWEATITLIAAFTGMIYLRRSAVGGELTRELPSSYLALTFALCRILPFLLFTRLALRAPALWGATSIAATVLLHDALVYRTYRYR